MSTVGDMLRKLADLVDQGSAVAEIDVVSHDQFVPRQWRPEDPPEMFKQELGETWRVTAKILKKTT